jgi:hypothetical protein
MVTLAVGGASERKSTAIERTAVVAVNAARVSRSPVCNATRDALRLTPSRNLGRKRAFALNKHKRDDPDGKVKEQQPCAVFELGYKSLDKPQRIFLDNRQKGLDAKRLWIHRTLGPLHERL